MAVQSGFWAAAAAVLLVRAAAALGDVAAAPALCNGDASTPAQVQATCDDFCAGKCAFNTAQDTGATAKLTVYRETPHNMTSLAEKDCGDVYGDVSFYLANHNIAYECHKNPKASSCTSNNAIELNSQGNIFIEYEVEVDGSFGPYQMCNPLYGWDTKHWSCLTYCEQPPSCAPWRSQKAQLGWMGPTCFCENGRSNRTVGRSLRGENSSHHHGHHHPNPSSWPATCGKAGYNDISGMGYEINGTVYKTLTSVDAAECCDACNAEPSGKCVGWSMPGDGKQKANCRLSTEPSDWVSTGGANVTSGGKFHHGAGHISDGVLGGFWLSMPAQGECKKPPSTPGCTWRTVTSGKQVNASCATAGVDAAIVANQPSCFANCTDPTDLLSACYNLCFAQALQGNATLGWQPMDRDDVVAPFLAAFASEDPEKGGCEDLRRASGQ